MDLVVETFNAKRNNVSNSNNEGNIENCSASCVFIDTKITTKARDIFTNIKILSSHPGSGMTNMTIINTTPTKIDKSLAFMIYSPYHLYFIFYSIYVSYNFCYCLVTLFWDNITNFQSIM